MPTVRKRGDIFHLDQPRNEREPVLGNVEKLEHFLDRGTDQDRLPDPLTHVPETSLKKSWGHRFRGGPNPVTSVEVVEALPTGRFPVARSASPLRWLDDSP